MAQENTLRLKNKLTILSTKNLKESTLNEARIAGVQIIEQPLISIRHLQSQELTNKLNQIENDIAITSANAVEAILLNIENASTLFAGKRVYCLEQETLIAMQKIQGIQISGTAKNATDLAEVIKNDQVKSITHVCGNRRRDELSRVLSAASIETNDLVVYETLTAPVAIEHDFDAILFFSPSAVESFFSANELQEEVACFTMGNITAASIHQYCQNEVVIAADTTQEALIKRVREYFQDKEIKNDK